MSTPWEKLYSAAMAAEKRGDADGAADLRAIGDMVEKASARKAAADLRRAGSNAFRSDEEEAALREDNQTSFYKNGDRGR